jgi:uncharacterized protein (UPF0216 family)
MVWLKDGNVRFFKEDELEEAQQYAKMHDTWIRLV